MKSVFNKLVGYQLSRQVGLSDAVRTAKEYTAGGESAYKEALKGLPSGLHEIFDEAIAQRLTAGYALYDSVQYVLGLMPAEDYAVYEAAIAELLPATEAAPAKSATKKGE
jgi:hypothetical protein